MGEAAAFRRAIARFTAQTAEFWTDRMSASGACEVNMARLAAGFVRPGQRVVVKLEAFPFTRYGTLEGVVDHVSPDATVDQQRGLVFPARIRLTKTALEVDGKPALLSPGMAASAEVVTGKRRVIDHLWSPVAKSVQEAGREQ